MRSQVVFYLSRCWPFISHDYSIANDNQVPSVITTSRSRKSDSSSKSDSPHDVTQNETKNVTQNPTQSAKSFRTTSDRQPTSVTTKSKNRKSDNDVTQSVTQNPTQSAKILDDDEANEPSMVVTKSKSKKADSFAPPNVTSCSRRDMTIGCSSLMTHDGVSKCKSFLSNVDGKEILTCSVTGTRNLDEKR